MYLNINFSEETKKKNYLKVSETTSENFIKLVWVFYLQEDEKRKTFPIFVVCFMHKALSDFKFLFRKSFEGSDWIYRVWKLVHNTHILKSTHWKNVHNQSMRVEDRWWFLKLAEACTIFFFCCRKKFLSALEQFRTAQLWKVFKTLILSRVKVFFYVTFY